MSFCSPAQEHHYEQVTDTFTAGYNRGMTYTPIPKPVPSEKGHMVVCDGCLTSTRVKNQGDTPIGWTTVYVEGWVGTFHSCSGICEEKIIKARGEKR